VALIKSISGIRGTIGGKPGENLSPLDIVKFAAAFGSRILALNKGRKIVIGRDGRISGEMVSQLVVSTLRGSGLDVVDLGLSPTRTVELAVAGEKAAGGIIITASHNPKEWNALKLLDSAGEFISAEEGAAILEKVRREDFSFAPVDRLGSYTVDNTWLQKHIDAVVSHPLVDTRSIQKKEYKIVVDTINSTGALFLPPLLKALGVKDVILLNEEVNGRFAHNPEPLPENLSGLSATVQKSKADVGIAVDPDVDRLCFVCEDGSMFGEEYTLVAVADYVLKHRKGNTVSNMSSTRALKDITIKHGGEYSASAVGEVHVVNKMKAVNAVIGGEGNGGVIFPELHYGRDSLIGIALFLSHLAKSKMTASALRKSYPEYFISKNKIELTPDIDVDQVLEKVKQKYQNEKINTIDGVKIDFEREKEWIHLRKSNTEPIIRIYAESQNEGKADELAQRIISDIKSLI